MTGEHTPAPSVYETPSLADRETAPSFVSVPATTTSRPSQGRPRGAASTYFDTYTPSAGPSREYRPIELIARGMNGCLHGAACVVLIALMVEFLAQVEGAWPEQIAAQAVTLLLFLALDTLLDIISLVRLQKQWAPWALHLRLVSGVAYIILFMAYIAHGNVFPQGYSFWAMPPMFTGPVVYIFLWLLGLWNLCHVALRRHRLGRGLRACIPSSSAQPLSPGSTANPRWRRWIGTRDRYSRTADRDVETQPHFQPRVMAMDTIATTTAPPSPSVSLQDRPVCAEVDVKRPSYTATASSASSHSSAKTEKDVAASRTGEDEAAARRGKKEEGI